MRFRIQGLGFSEVRFRDLGFRVQRATRENLCRISWSLRAPV